MDYLLRDSLHCGVAYGHFDHHRLIDTLRVLFKGGDSEEPVLGIEKGGLHSAESLLLARYFMFSQVYFHHVRRAYDTHLKDFLTRWLPGGEYNKGLAEHLAMTDVQVIAGIAEVAADAGHDAHDPARRLTARGHFRELWTHNPSDLNRNPGAGRLVYEAARECFGDAAVRRESHHAQGPEIDFPVQMNDERIEWASAVSTAIANIPNPAFDYVFIDPAHEGDAKRWLRDNHDTIIPANGENPNGQT